MQTNHPTNQPNTDREEYPSGLYGDIIKAVKRAFPDVLVFLRIGDFLEAFGPDARIAEEHAGVKTHTPRGKAYSIAGFPHHVAGVYIDRLTAAGYRVATIEAGLEPKGTAPTMQNNQQTNPTNQQTNPTNMDGQPRYDPRATEIIERHIENEETKEGIHLVDLARSIIQRAYVDAEEAQRDDPDAITSPRADAADALREYFDEENPLYEEPSVWFTLLDFALDRCDWYAIVDHQRRRMEENRHADQLRRIEQREARFIEEHTASLIKQGYSPERAAELATWELHVRSGGD